MVDNMGEAGSSVTLIFYRMSDRWWREPVLNIAAAACQMSSFTHVEIAIGGIPPPFFSPSSPLLLPPPLPSLFFSLVALCALPSFFLPKKKGRVGGRKKHV